jgi:hypothetical protein
MLGVPNTEPTVMRCELSDSEWSAIRMMLPNKPHLAIARSDRAAPSSRACGRARRAAYPPAGGLGHPPGRDRAFAFKIAAAALLALFLALWIDLPRPYWAVSTVFITMQPARPARRPSIRFWIAWPLVLS